MVFFRKTQSKRDVFSRYYRERLTPKQLERELWKVPLSRTDKEYVKRVMERFSHPYYSQGITREEFERGLKEMEENYNDPIDKKEIERIRKHFLGE